MQIGRLICCLLWTRSSDLEIWTGDLVAGEGRQGGLRREQWYTPYTVHNGEVQCAQESMCSQLRQAHTHSNLLPRG